MMKYLLVVFLVLRLILNESASIYSYEKSMKVFARNPRSKIYNVQPSKLTKLTGAPSDGLTRDEELPTVTDFFSRDSRLRFIRKVYSIFGLQTFTTFAMILATQQSSSFQKFLLRSSENLSVLSLLGSFIVPTIFAFSKPLRQSFPVNLILLMLFTVCYSTGISLFAIALDSKVSVMMALLYTVIAFFSITIYSFRKNPKYDFHYVNGLLFTGSLTVLIGSLLNSLFFHLPLAENLISMITAILFAGYILHDTKMIITGKKKMRKAPRVSGKRGTSVQRTEDNPYYNSREYMLASMNLYLDVMGLLVELMKILARLKENNNRRQKEQNGN
jgi:FtsH-binding integral membrane protein